MSKFIHHITLLSICLTPNDSKKTFSPSIKKGIILKERRRKKIWHVFIFFKNPQIQIAISFLFFCWPTKALFFFTWHATRRNLKITMKTRNVPFQMIMVWQRPKNRPIQHFLNIIVIRRRSKQVKQEEESICYNHNFSTTFFHLENVNVEMELNTRLIVIPIFDVW